MTATVSKLISRTIDRLPKPSGRDDHLYGSILDQSASMITTCVQERLILPTNSL